mgnify:CR=1 FL=1
MEINEKIIIYLDTKYKLSNMKKLSVILIFTGISFAASAQQNDFFDIQKYLQKKRKETKPAIKPLFVKPSIQNQFVFQADNVNSHGKFSLTLSNGDKVYLLPQDNMPCITPGISQYNTRNLSGLNKYNSIPVFPDNTPGSIPNAVIPKRIIIAR